MGTRFVSKGEMKLSRKQRFSDEELWNIATKHKNALSSVSEWKRYAKENGLPHS